MNVSIGRISLPLQKAANYYFIILILLICLCNEISPQEERIEDFLLCKFCGADVADLDYVVNIKSPSSIKAENQTLSGKPVLLQTLRNPLDIYFDVITVKKSNCVGLGEWKKEDTWFPGFAWKVCVCQPWGHFLGWVFEPIDKLKVNQRKASEKGFYALIAENTLTEQFSNSLLIVPKSFKS